MNLVKEINIERKSLFEKFVYYAIHPEDPEVIDRLNAILAKNYGAEDFQVAKIEGEDEATGEKFEECYIVVFRVNGFQYIELQKAFELMIDLKFGDVTELID